MWFSWWGGYVNHVRVCYCLALVAWPSKRHVDHVGCRNGQPKGMFDIAFYGENCDQQSESTGRESSSMRDDQKMELMMMEKRAKIHHLALASHTFLLPSCRPSLHRLIDSEQFFGIPFSQHFRLPLACLSLPSTACFGCLHDVCCWYLQIPWKILPAVRVGTFLPEWTLLHGWHSALCFCSFLWHHHRFRHSCLLLIRSFFPLLSVRHLIFSQQPAAAVRLLIIPLVIIF